MKTHLIAASLMLLSTAACKGELEGEEPAEKPVEKKKSNVVKLTTAVPYGKHLACGGLHKASNPLGAVNEPLVVVFEWEAQKKVHSHVSDGVRGVAWRTFYLQDGSLLGASGGSGGGFLIFWKPEEDKN